MRTKDVLAKAIKERCLKTAPEGEYFLGKLPGARYKTQYYLSNILYDQDMLAIITEEFLNIVEKEIGHWKFQLTGREWAAIPLLVGIPAHLRTYGIDINSFMIKRKRKTYGVHNYIEGVPNDLPVLIVDDLCNSTDSFRHCLQVCESSENKLEVLPFIFSVLNKYRYAHYQEEEPEKYDRYLGRKYKALSILTGDDIANSR